jgi:hypothetical protein
MSHQDKDVADGGLNSRHLRIALQWILAAVNWSGIVFREDCTWTPRLLASAAIAWAWSSELTLEDRFVEARRLMAHLFSQSQLATTYQAFLKMLCRWTDRLLSRLLPALRMKMRENLARHWHVAGYVVFGVDGSRVELPRTKSNEAAFAPAPDKKRRKKHSRSDSKKAATPLMWLTTMLHLGTGLPWDWRVGPSTSSERTHALEMLSDLPESALLAGDAGFIGYDFARTVLNSGRNLLVRVGANVRLLRKLGYVRESEGTVYVWPDAAARKQQPPLVFRLVIAHGPRHPIYLITSVLSSTHLTNQQVFEIYKKRWGIELFYRHFKQTFQRRKLRSAKAENALVELHWSMIGLWAMSLVAMTELCRHAIPPHRLSAAGVLRVFRRFMRDYLHPLSHGLRPQLRQAVVDTYIRRQKASRDYPRKKKHERIGIPTIEDATPTQIRIARQLCTAS